MPKFQYYALKDKTKIIKGELDASSPREAREKIVALGFIPTKVYIETADQQIEQKKIKINPIKHISLKDKIFFTSELEVLLSAGIPILEALQSIETNSSNIKIQTCCKNLQLAIQSGMSFAQSLRILYGKAFGEIYLNLVEVGEKSGELEETLNRILILLKKQESIKEKIINASIYPSILIIIMLGLLVLFSKFVFPILTGFIITNGNEVPLLAQTLIDICNFTSNFWWLIILFFGAFIAIFTQVFKISELKSKLDRFVLKIPVISDFIRYINLSNFLTLMHISYESGLPIVSSLELSRKSIGNQVLNEGLFSVLNHIKKGKTLTEAFNTKQVLPLEFLTMISAGEKSGTLGKMLKNCADIVDKRIDMVLETMAKLFEPTVIIIMGVVVLFIALAFTQLYIGMLGSLF